MITVGAALKKIALAKISEPKTAKIVCGIAIGAVLVTVMPVVAVVSVLNGNVSFSKDNLSKIIQQKMEEEHGRDIILYNDTMQKVESALKKPHLEKFNTLAEVLYLFYLSEKSEEKNFVLKKQLKH